MKAKVFICGLILLFIYNISVVQAAKPPIRWGVLMPEDIKMTVYAPDPNAPAVVLCDYGTAAVAPRVEYTRHVRIKILREAGLEYTKVEIPYRSYDNYDIFSEIRAHTLNATMNGNRMNVVGKSAKIEDVQTDARHRKKVITFIDAKAGSFLEYSYTIYSLDIVKLNNWYFQSTIPVVWSEYRVYIPRRLNYLVTFQQGRQLDLNEQQDYASRLQWLYSNQITNVYSDLVKQKGILYESPKKSIKVYLTSGESLRFVLDNIPAVAPKPVNMDLFSSVKVHLYLTEGYLPFYYRPALFAASEDYDVWNKWDSHYRWWPDFFVTYWLPTWQEASQKWIESEYLGYRVVENFNAKPVMDAISHTDSLNVLKGLFQYVKENIKWDGTYSMYAQHNFNEVLKMKSGSSGEMNLFLINLLRKAGFKVNPVLIRTSDLGRIENLYPEKGQFNHVVAQVEMNGMVLYFDATNQTNSIELPGNVQHTVGWLLKEKGSKWVDVENYTPPVIVSPATFKQT